MAQFDMDEQCPITHPSYKQKRLQGWLIRSLLMFPISDAHNFIFLCWLFNWLTSVFFYRFGMVFVENYFFCVRGWTQATHETQCPAA